MLTAFSIVDCLLLSVNVIAQQVECEEGSCRASTTDSNVQICGSGYWQELSRGPYVCMNDVMILEDQADAGLDTQSSKSRLDATFKPIQAQSSSPQMESRPVITKAQLNQCSAGEKMGRTGHSYCSGTDLSCRSDAHGIASYISGGKMASMYLRQGGSFRCDIEEPSDGLYVAFWTPYDSSQPSQPRPNSCGRKMAFKNPHTGATAEALVVDRCAGCVGVDHKTSDPTTPDTLVNGATVDLSEALWNLLYDSAAPSVYDIEYDGSPWAGSAEEPAQLTDALC